MSTASTASTAMVGFGGQVTGEGYVPAPGVTLNDLAGALRSMRVIRGAVGWWIGDLLVYAEDHFGEESSQLLAEIDDLEVPEMLLYRRISRAYPPSQRVAGVSWSHHREVIALPPPERGAWLARAKREGLGTLALRRLRRAEKPTGAAKVFAPDFIKFLHRVPPAIMDLYDKKQPGTCLLDMDFEDGCRVEVTVRLRRVAALAAVAADDAPDGNGVEPEGGGGSGLGGDAAHLHQG